MEQLTEQQLKEKRALYLLDTILFYNTENRGVKDGFGCSYVAGCAIGRKITKELATKLDSGFCKSITNESVFNQLPQHLKQLGITFLSEIQSLHDSKTFWSSETGINERGLKRIREIQKNYNLIF